MRRKVFASTIAGGCFALLLAVAAMTWPQIDQATGLCIMGLLFAGFIISAIIAMLPEPKIALSPDLSIHSLFFHIDPNVLEDPDGAHWERVGRDVLNRLSTGQLHAWGEFADGGSRPLTPIPKEFWADAEFTFDFLEKGERREEMIHVRAGGPRPAISYRNVRLNKAEAFEIWPPPKRAWRFLRFTQSA